MALPAEVVKLLEDLKSPKEEVRKKAVITLGRHNLPEVRDALNELVNDTSTAVRYFAKKAMKDFESMTAVQVEQTGGFDLAPRPSAPPAAPVTPPPAAEAPPRVEEPVKKSITPPPADLFGSGGGSLTKILNDLKSPDETVKIEAIKQLGEKKEVVATEPLLGLIHDPSKTVRLYAVQSLGLIGENRVLTPLLNLLNSEQDAFVVATLVKAIARVGGAQLIPIIARYLKDPDARTRANTIEALEIIGDPKIIKFLIPLLQDENNRVKANSIKVLSKFGKTNMFEKLDEMLHSDDASIRGSAIYALSAIGGEQVIELLEKAKDDEDPANLKKLAEGLAKINTERSLELLRELTFHPDAEVSGLARSLLGGGEAQPAPPGPKPAEPEIPKYVEPPAVKQAIAEQKPAQPQRPPQAEPQFVRQAPPAEPVKKTPPQEPVVQQEAARYQAPLDQPQFQSIRATGAPRNFTSQDFEHLWNDTLLLLNTFQKNHPDFTRDRMLAFLRSLESVLE